MSSTTMMTRMPIEEEAILLSLTKRMKLNSNFEDMKDRVTKVRMNTKENLSYILPSLSQEDINNYFQNGFTVKVQDSNENSSQLKSVKKKRNYTQMTTETNSVPIQEQNHVYTKTQNEIETDNETIKPNMDAIEGMIETMLKLNSKEGLKTYLIKMLNKKKQCNGLKDDNRKYLNDLQFKIDMIQNQIRSGIENANELNKTLQVTKSAKEKEANRALEKYELSKQVRELYAKVSTLKNQIIIERKTANEFKRMLLDQQE